MIYNFKQLKNSFLLDQSDKSTFKKKITLKNFFTYLKNNNKPFLYFNTTPLADINEFKNFLISEFLYHGEILIKKQTSFENFEKFYGDFYDFSKKIQKTEPKRQNTNVNTDDNINGIYHKIESLLKSSFLILDIENNEKNQKELLEIGLLFYSNGDYKIKHYIIKENIDKKNGIYVPDNKFNFDFGDSIIIEKNNAILEINKYLLLTNNFVGHGISNDVKLLEKHGAIFSKSNLIDTAKISKKINEKNEQMSIKRILTNENIEFKNLHNAGNDCYYNFLVLTVLKEKFLNSLNKKKNLYKM